MKEKKDLEDFELDGLYLGRTVYHPSTGSSKYPVVLNGIRRCCDTGVVQVEILYPDGYVQWVDIAGLSTIPEYYRKQDVLCRASVIIDSLNNSVEVSDVSIRELAELVVDLNRDVLSAKGW